MKKRTFIKLLSGAVALPYLGYASISDDSEFVENFYFNDPHTIEEHKRYFKYFFNDSTKNMVYLKYQMSARDKVEIGKCKNYTCSFNVFSQLDKCYTSDHRELWFVGYKKSYKPYTELVDLFRLKIKFA